MFLTVCIATTCYAQRFQGHKLVGYVPDYAEEWNVDYANLTHAIFAFLPVNSDGVISEYSDYSKPNFDNFIAKTDADSVIRGIAIGGAGTSFNDLTTDSLALSTFSDSLVKFCLYHDFKLVDIDWEGLSSAEESTNFSTLIDVLHPKLDSGGIEMSITLTYGDYWGQYFVDSTLHKADWLQIMVYDQLGTWAASSFGNHSSFDHFLEGESYWVNRGFSRDSLVIGVPFYGRKFNNPSGGIAPGVAYGDLVAQYPDLDENMNETPDLDYTFFNGPELIRQKTQYVMDQGLGGIMVWDMLQDAPGYKSLHQNIISVFNETNAPTRAVCADVNLDSGLVVQFDFDGNAINSLDVNVFPENEINYSHDRFGFSNNAAFFDGDDTLIYNNNPEFDLSDHSFSFWLNFSEEETGTQILFNKWGAGVDNYSYVSFLIDNRVGIQYQIVGNDVEWFVPPTLLKANNWYHISFTQNYDEGVHVYINGLAAYSEDVNFNVVSTPSLPFVIGQSTEEAYPFSGKIDDFRLYNRKLNQCEIDGLFYDHYSNETLVSTKSAEDLNSPIHVYPNPTNDLLNIEGEFTEAVLVNATGETILKTKEQPLALEVLAPGLYTLIISTTDGTKIVKKIVKN